MKQFKTFLQEAIELEYHQELNKELFDNEELKSEICSKLISIAQEFIKFIKAPKEAVLDIVLTGSLCNYNYTAFSDIDVHCIINKEVLLPNSMWTMETSKIVDEYLKSKKKNWALQHNIQIKGFPVEMYCQDSHETYVNGQGIYSIIQKRWLQKPIHGLYNFNDETLNRKIKMWEIRINDALMSNASIEVINNIRDRLSKMRKAGILKGGEFSQENLIFKSLRNNNFLNRLANYKRIMFDRSFSI